MNKELLENQVKQTFPHGVLAFRLEGSVTNLPYAVESELPELVWDRSSSDGEVFIGIDNARYKDIHIPIKDLEPYLGGFITSAENDLPQFYLLPLEEQGAE